MKKKFLFFLGVLFGKWILKFLYGTNRWYVEGENKIKQLRNEGKSIIFATWHGNLLPGYLYIADKQPYGLAGHHGDAEIISRIAEKIGYTTIRGSSTEGGREAYRKIVDVLENEKGSLIFITPDGPKGPAKEPKPGAVKAAIRTGAVILPTGSFVSRYWSSTNWDTFYVAKPFGKTFLLMGEPLVFSKEDDFEECSRQLKEQLDLLEEEAKRRAEI
ncbi:MAG: lysophospholipid acyltransferase family protein [Fidelibacterota bacterium]